MSIAVAATDRITSHRPELEAYCRRMLGSPFDADDAVQETLLRAWRASDGFEGRASLRGWLYRIATNVCFDALKSRSRRPTPTDEWPEETEDSRTADPVELALDRDQLRLALIAAANALPPRQLAVLLLRDVLSWRAREVAQRLSTSVAAVNSAHQRARESLARSNHELLPIADGDPADQLVGRYLAAFQADDVDGLTTLILADVEADFAPPIFRAS